MATKRSSTGPAPALRVHLVPALGADQVLA